MRLIPVDKATFLVGRRTTADLQMMREDVSREHARIERTGDQCVVSDLGSRSGTFVNDEPLTAPRVLVHGDRIRFGRTGAAEVTFLTDEGSVIGLTEGGPAEMSDLRQMAAILNGLRALGSGRVLDEVLALVLGSALEVTGAERGFIMLATPAGALEFRTGRTKSGAELSGPSFTTSQKIPHEVFATNRSRIVSDLMDGDLAGAHGRTIATGIRHVLCVPLRVVPFGPSSGQTADRVIGVLYLDGRERGRLLSTTTVTSLEAFATQAALAIESARLYAESAEKARTDRDLKVAAEIQRALLPEPRWRGATLDLAASTTPCRTVGGDLFDYLELGEGVVGFALGDVAGKGPPAAILAATVQSHFAAHAPIASDPADLMTRLNRALLRRAVEARFATMFYGVLSPSGELAYTNAGQEPPIVVRADGTLTSLDVGGPVLGLLPAASYQWARLSLAPGDIVLVCSDGVTEARNPAGDEYGLGRLSALLASAHGGDPDDLVAMVLASVNEFAGTEPQGDDVTLMAVRYRG